MAGTLNENDIGMPIRVTIVKDLAATPLVPRVLDPANDSVNLVFTFPSGARKVFAATIIDGPNAIVEYTTLAGDIPELGKTDAQAKSTFASPAQVLGSSIHRLTIGKEL